MDFVNKFTGGGQQKTQQQHASSSEGKKEEGGFFGGLGNKMNEAAGGGKKGEQDEDLLDKGECTTPCARLSCQAAPPHYAWAELIMSRRRLCPGEVSWPRTTGQ